MKYNSIPVTFCFGTSFIDSSVVDVSVLPEPWNRLYKADALQHFRKHPWWVPYSECRDQADKLKPRLWWEFPWREGLVFGVTKGPMVTTLRISAQYVTRGFSLQGIFKTTYWPIMIPRAMSVRYARESSQTSHTSGVTKPMYSPSRHQVSHVHNVKPFSRQSVVLRLMSVVSTTGKYDTSAKMS